MNQSSEDSITIALDAMGGDNAPRSVLEGASLAQKLYPNVRFLLFGDEERLSLILKNLPSLKKSCEIIHTETTISNDDKPSIALRQGRNSSMGLAIKAVRDGTAQGVVSAGNTGALMAMSKFLLRPLPGISRPAIAGVLPTKTGQCIVLDLGANVDCDADNLFQFAVMGDAFARTLLHLKHPTIGILNIGTEELKGNYAVKNASELLRNTHTDLNFYGHVEGDDIFNGVVDIIVTDGFSGNIALKTAEGTAKMCFSFLQDAFKSSLLAKLGYLLSRRALRTLSERIDPRMHNGAMFLGLNGVAVKSHGGTDALGFSHAIGVAIKMISNNINSRIVEELKHAHEDVNGFLEGNRTENDS